MSLLTTIVAFVAALGTLIVFHEFGHYIVARWCGVKVLRFSVGFGKPLWQRKLGREGTEWAIGAIPIGGYVKMLDEREGPVAPHEQLVRIERHAAINKILDVPVIPRARRADRDIGRLAFVDRDRVG